ncbi:DUF2201 family putative metallopeptidase [Kocuria dechangensis]|nr:VWA-like domain-containing protein [Kocuria dechangensis]
MKTIADLTDTQLDSWRAGIKAAVERMPYFADLIYKLTPLISDDVVHVSSDTDYRVYIAAEALESDDVLLGEMVLHAVHHLFSAHHQITADLGVPHSRKVLFNLAADLFVNDELITAGCVRIAEHSVHHSHLGFEKQESVQAYYRLLVGRFRDDEGLGAEDDATGCGSVVGLSAPYEYDGELGHEVTEAMTEAEIAEIVATTVQNILDTDGGWGVGVVPGGLLASAAARKEVTTTPWEKILDAYMSTVLSRAKAAAKASYKRINRRHHSTVTASGRKVINPGKAGKSLTATVYIDQSGSMAQAEINMAVAECHTIADRRGVTLQVAYVDTRVHEPITYTGPESLPVATPNGGTDMIAAITHAEASGTALCIVATDGGTPWPSEKPSVPVIVVLTQAGWRLRESVPSWANVVRMDSPNGR